MLDISPRPPWRATLPHTAAAVPMARALVRDALTDLAKADDTDTAELLTAELVANAVEHTTGDEPIRLVVDLSPTGSCHVEVHDDDPEPPRDLTRPGPTVMPEPWQEDGRGLLLIRMLSAACGHRPTDRGKAVWFTLLGTAPTHGTTNGPGTVPGAAPVPQQSTPAEWTVRPCSGLA